MDSIVIPEHETDNTASSETVLTAVKQPRRSMGRPFVKGVSGNPNGRPKGTFSIITKLKNELQKIPEGADKTYAELLIKRILKSAINDGNDQQIKNILQYVEGMPQGSQPVNAIQVNNYTYTKKEEYDDLVEALALNMGLPTKEILKRLERT